MSEKRVLTDAEFQREVSSFVARELIYSVSSLLYSLIPVADQLDDYDAFIELGRRVDYDEAIDEFFENADTDELVEAADVLSTLGDLDPLGEIFDSIGVVPSACALEGFAEDRCLSLDDNDDKQDALDSWKQAPDALGYLDKQQLEKVKKEIRGSISDKEEFCRAMSICLEDHENEVYEHWIVSDYLARQLQKRGETVVEFLGLTVWGRCTTGMAVYMDNVMQEIAREALNVEVIG